VHELSISHGVLEVALAALECLPPPVPRVERVTVRVGRLTAVVPDSLHYHFDLLIPGTSLEGAELVIEEIPIRGRCAECVAEFEIDTLSFVCPRCGSGFVELYSGRELDVVSRETVEEVPRAG
jgi:hydrogenase nickel incorporation protein HypA/HybF